MRKSILITGATSGIGKSAALVFAKNQYNVILTGRREDRLIELTENIKSQYQVNVQYLVMDVRDLKSVQKAIQSIDHTLFPTMDVLLNNAGLASGLSTIDEGHYSDWEAMIDTNFKGLLYVSREIMPIMTRQGFGHIINISSTAGKQVYAKGNVYCATKHAVDALSQSMRIDLLPYGIKVTAVSPGACETEFSIVRFHGDKEKADAVYDGFDPLKPEDVADTIYYCTTLPKHVCINDLTITCLTQANSTNNVKRKVY
jgi:NADP-dependent 3-hydroxy acid dehydrogenase YdfG